MKVSLLMELVNGNRVPFEHKNNIAISVIKKIQDLENDKDTYNQYYFNDNQYNKKMKCFASAIMPIDYKTENQNFITDKLQLIMSIGNKDSKTLKKIYINCNKNSKFTYRGLNFNLKGLRVKQDKEINSNEALFKTLSNIVIKEKNGEFITPNDENFNSTLNFITDAELKDNRGYGLKKKLTFIPIDIKKQIVKVTLNRNGIDILNIPSSYGTFVLKGDKEDLNSLQQLGMGFRRGQGFGVITQI